MALEPGEIQTPRSVVDHMVELVARLGEVVATLEKADLKAAQLRHDADLAESMAYVDTDGTQEFRRSIAKIQAADIESQAIVAEALVRHLKRSISALGLEIEVARSQGAALRSELASLPYSRDP